MVDKEQFFRDLYEESTEGEQEAKKETVSVALKSGQPSLDQTKDLKLHVRKSASTVSSPGLPSERLTSSRQGKSETAAREGLSTRVQKNSAGQLSRIRPTNPKESMKRKRGFTLNEIPESRRVFRGKVFYFFPNNDISKARRFRIQKSCEYGAFWVKEWQIGVTHVIVDQDVKYEEVLEYLGISSIPPEILVVHEDYPADCIAYHHLVNPEQRQYQVPRTQAVVPISSGTSALSSLPLKPEKQASAQTASGTEGSDESAAARELKALSEQRTAPHTNDSMNKLSDALDDAIQEAKKFQDLPLDGSESETDVIDDERSSDEQEEARTKKLKRSFVGSRGEPKNLWQQSFLCMEKHDGSDKGTCPNARTIEILQKMADYYDRMQDHWRTIAYRKAISTLRKQPAKITTKSEAMAFPTIGERLAEKIEEIVWTDRLRRLEHTELELNDEILQIFMKIYSVGHKQASAWVSSGYRTLEDLTSKASLSKNQTIGIAHYEDFQARIPRAEVTKHGSLVRAALLKINPIIEVQIAGSYRRGAKDSGDVDFIITAKDTTIAALRILALDELIPSLFATNYLKCGLAVSSSDTGSKWHGAACLPGSSPSIWRRVDFLLVPWEEHGAALIYFTGNDIFNRSIRLLARKKGWRLNQRGLWKDVIRGPGTERLTRGSLLESRSERRIFELLDVSWRPPEHRIC